MSAVLAIVEANSAATVLAAVLLGVDPWGPKRAARLAVAVGALASIPFGAPLLGASLLFWAAPTRPLTLGPATAGLSVALSFGMSNLVEGVPGLLLPIHPATFTFLALPSLVLSAVARSVLGPVARLAALLYPMIVCGLACLAELGGWWSQSLVTSEFSRLALLLPMALLALLPSAVRQPTSFPRFRNEVPLLAGVVAWLLTSLVLPVRPVSSVVFDESHGPWATSTSSLDPGDFGRAHLYTYSLLFQYARRLAGSASTYDGNASLPPPAEALFVLKMPVRPLSDDFTSELAAWVKGGGRLLVVADHTDLFDSTQNLNPFLHHLAGIRVATDAVYDERGLPNAIDVPSAFRLLGRVDALGVPLAYQTGASFESIAWSTRTLATYSRSYAEPGDYSRPNRFGRFVPRATLPFACHPAVVAQPVGSGLVVVFADSTPWSNFSLGARPNAQFFKALLGAATRPAAFRVLNVSVLSLALLAVLYLVLPSPYSLAVMAISGGVTLAAGFAIGRPASGPLVYQRDFDVQVSLGSDTRLSYLPQLAKPGDHNFARVLAALPKFNLLPLVDPPGHEEPSLAAGGNYLFLDPDPAALPPSTAVFRALRGNARITVLFPANAARDEAIRDWINQLSFRLIERTSLALQGDSNTGLLERAGPLLATVISFRVEANNHSLWIRDRASAVADSFRLDSTKGVVAIGFSSDQFSDSAIGSVWEGKVPSAIGALREEQLGALIGGREIPRTSGRVVHQIDGNAPILSRFAIFENGAPIKSGTLVGKTVVGPPEWPAPDLDGYLLDLQSRALGLIEAHCTVRDGESCSSHLLDSELLEWVVGFSKDAVGIRHVELVHHRDFPGPRKTINILFAR